MSSITTDYAAGVLTVTLNRPDKLNAFTAEMLVRLREAMSEAAADDKVRAILLTGAGRGFCAGQDLGERAPADMSANIGAMLTDYYNPAVRAIRELSKPVVCAVNGAAAGAGANLPLACDFVIAAKSATFIQAFAKIGLIPDCGGTWHLPRLIGLPRAKALAMLAEPLPAQTAADWGLIYRAVDDADLRAEAEALARRLADGASAAFGEIKHAMHNGLACDLDEHLNDEAAAQQRVAQTADHAEGMRAFMEKRDPKFTGKRSG